jgi:hypothetical protein
MPRTKIEAQQIPGAINAPTGVEVTYTLCDAVNGNRVRLTGGEVLSVYGTGAITIHSVPDALNRTGDLTLTLDNTERHVLFGPFAVPGWGQSDGYLYFNGAAGLYVAWLSPSR